MILHPTHFAPTLSMEGLPTSSAPLLLGTLFISTQDLAKITQSYVMSFLLTGPLMPIGILNPQIAMLPPILQTLRVGLDHCSSWPRTSIRRQKPASSIVDWIWNNQPFPVHHHDCAKGFSATFTPQPYFAAVLLTLWALKLVKLLSVLIGECAKGSSKCLLAKPPKDGEILVWGSMWLLLEVAARYLNVEILRNQRRGIQMDNGFVSFFRRLVALQHVHEGIMSKKDANLARGETVMVGGLSWDTFIALKWEGHIWKEMRGTRCF